MTSISDEEVRQRLSDIAQGPWTGGAAKAYRRLAPLGKIRVGSFTGARMIALSDIPLSTSNKKKSRRLATVLRPHFEDSGGITDPAEHEIRDGLDDALMVAQLYELAVQTDYLPASGVRRPARKILTNLLWSAPARGFVAAYDYVAVPMLASRVDVSGIGKVQPPEPDANAALRFAGFLAHLRAFYADDQIQTWTRFLDDYIYEADEQNRLLRYLRGERKDPPRRIGELLTGCHLFVISLSSAFHVLNDDELGRFGLIHAYWLQKSFGYKKTQSGYVKNVDLWGTRDSWANTIVKSLQLGVEGIDVEIAKLFRHQFSKQVKLLERAFDAVRLLTKSTRQAPDTPAVPRMDTYSDRSPANRAQKEDLGL